MAIIMATVDAAKYISNGVEELVWAWQVPTDYKKAKKWMNVQKNSNLNK